MSQPLLQRQLQLRAGEGFQPPQRLPFQVPSGLVSLVLKLELTGADKRTRVDVVLLGPGGFVGSGMTQGGCLKLVVRAEQPTPGVLPGPVTPGEWRLLLMPVNVEGLMTATVEITVTPGQETTLAAAVLHGDDRRSLDDAPGWRKGDLHVHSVHSTGTQAVAQLVESAARAGLDFISVTDHNTISAWPELVQAQETTSDVLLIRGQELTAAWGHMNVHGGTGWADLRLGDNNLAELTGPLRRSGALVSVNHPFSNNVGWQRHDTDWSLIDLIEVYNALEFGHNRIQLDYWDRLLNAGARVVGVAATDSKSTEDPKYDFGRTVTWVYAQDLSVNGVLAGLRSGRVVVSVGPRVDFWAQQGGRRIEMGQTALPGAPLTLNVSVVGLEAAATVFVIKNGLFFDAEVLHGDGVVLFNDTAVGAGTSVYRVEVHKLLQGEPDLYDRRHRSHETFLAATNPVWAGAEPITTAEKSTKECK